MLMLIFLTGCMNITLYFFYFFGFQRKLFFTMISNMPLLTMTSFTKTTSNQTIKLILIKTYPIFLLLIFTKLKINTLTTF